jgi:hypothetical protein
MLRASGRGAGRRGKLSRGEEFCEQVVRESLGFIEPLSL